jgi:hypothetical protein
VALARTNPSVRGGGGLRTRSIVIARCSIADRSRLAAAAPVRGDGRARTPRRRAPARWIDQRARLSLVGSPSHDALGRQADVDVLDRDAWPPSLSSPSDSLGLIEQKQLPAAEPRGGFSADHRAALEFGELARDRRRGPLLSSRPWSHGALIMPGAGEASRRAREPWLVPGGAADPAAHRVAPGGLRPNFFRTSSPPRGVVDRRLKAAKPHRLPAICTAGITVATATDCLLSRGSQVRILQGASGEQVRGRANPCKSACSFACSTTVEHATPGRSYCWATSETDSEPGLGPLPAAPTACWRFSVSASGRNPDHPSQRRLRESSSSAVVAD